jgi:hypothetical protein
MSAFGLYQYNVLTVILLKTFSKATVYCDPEDLKIHINEKRKFMFWVIFRRDLKKLGYVCIA